ncbi:MAG: DUF6544 family protein, partial [Syntrophomonas sp.]
QKETIKKSDLAGLPPCVQKWLERSGIVGKEKIHTVRLIQSGRMRTEEGKPWMPMEAVQYINVDNPGFIWRAKVKPAPFINLVGKDKYCQGQGSMLIKLLALFPVVDAQSGKEINQGSLLRFLAEMAWYPSAALNDYIKWEEINEHSAKATMTWQGTSASMVFYFDEQGDFNSSLARRYREADGKFVLDDWGGIARGYQEFNGVRISNKLDVTWKLKSGDFNWMQVQVTRIDYNQPEIF